MLRGPDCRILSSRPADRVNSDEARFRVGNETMRPHLLVGIENTERRRDMTGPPENADDKKIAPRVGGSSAFRVGEPGRRWRSGRPRRRPGQ